MTDEQIRIKVAEAMGFAEIRMVPSGMIGVRQYTGFPIPDYPNSLDACSAFEEKMWNTPNDRPKKQKWGRYRNELKRICLRDGQRPAICANAHQRCEAFLIANGLWEE